MDNSIDTRDTDKWYPVLTPVKHKGAIVKPPAHIKLSADEAEPHFSAGTIGQPATLIQSEHDLAFIGRLGAERLEAERIQAERIEAERLEAERIQAGRLEAKRLRAERIEAERLEAERIEAGRFEAERLEAERIEAVAKAAIKPGDKSKLGKQ